MKEAVIKRWAKALTSGEYKQGRARLCNGLGEMCCLGVLIDTEFDGEWVQAGDGDWNFDGLAGVLSESALKQLDADPDLNNIAVAANDVKGLSFKTIAKQLLDPRSVLGRTARHPYGSS